MRAQDAQIGDASVEEFYLNGLKSVPSLWKRLTNAQRVTDVVGMKRIENAYREASGPGWALIGDALHYKDPLDGQGIYDALVEAKILGEIVGQWKRGELKGWSDAGALYWQRVNEATHEMFLSTVARVKNEVHTIPPKFVLKTIVRWMLTDPEYQHNFLNYLARELPPSVIADGPNPRFILRGIGRDLKALVTRKSAAS